MKRRFLLLCFFFSAILIAQGQSIYSGKKAIEIPFEYQNNFIILNVKFNKTLPLRFIFDTGAEFTILTKRELSDLIGIRYDRTFRIIGADLTTELTAYLATRIHFQIAKLISPAENILVLDEDYFKFEELTGIEVHGLIGASLFSRYIVKIDYKKRIITLYNPIYFDAPDDSYFELPIEVHKNKPYLKAQVLKTPSDEPFDLKLLLDTGASLSLLVHTDSTTGVIIPEQVIRGNIGMGLGGYLEGFIGRLYQLEFGAIQLNSVITNFQSLNVMQDTSYLHGRHGIIGNLILDRFEVIIDYYNERLYLKPNRSFKKKFKYDRSGIIIIAGGKNLNTFTVNQVIEGSPAYEAGVEVGDEIKKINWLPTGYLTMNDLSNILMKKEGKRIKLKLKRNGKTIKVTFYLRDLF